MKATKMGLLPGMGESEAKIDELLLARKGMQDDEDLGYAYF
jgi:hypothetical protein